MRPHREETRAKHIGIPPPGRNPIGSIRFQPIENRRSTRPLPGRMRKLLAGPPIRGKKSKRVHFRADAPSSGPNFHPRGNPTQSLSPRSKATTLLPDVLVRKERVGVARLFLFENVLINYRFMGTWSLRSATRLYLGSDVRLV